MKYRVILLDTQEAPEELIGVSADDLTEYYSNDPEASHFFSQEFDLPGGLDDETTDKLAVLIGRGILFTNDFTADDTVSTVVRV